MFDLIASCSARISLSDLSVWLYGFVFSGLLLMPHVANACVTSAAMAIEDIIQADAIFSGKVLSYEIVSPGRPDTLDDYGMIKVRVVESLKGDASGDVQLYWWNSTFGMPEELHLTEPALFAAVAPGKKALPLRAPSGTIFPTRRADLWEVMQAPCAGAFMLPFTNGTAKNVRDFLAGKKVDIYDSIGPTDKISFRTTPATHRTEQAASPAMLAGAIGLFAILASTFWIRRRRRGIDIKVGQRQ